MAFVPTRKSSLLVVAGDRSHFAMMCQLIAGICSYLTWMSIIYLSTDSSQLSSDRLRVAVAIGVGFGQLAMTGFWLAFVFGWSDYSLGIVVITLETLAVVFFSSISARFIPPSFFVAILLACAVIVLLMWGTAKIANRVFRISLTSTSKTPIAPVPRAQYRIRDLLAAMAVIAIFASLVQSRRSELIAFSGTLQFFGLIVCSYYFLSWPSIVACLGRSCMRNAAIAIPVTVVFFLLQLPVFSRSFVASGESWQFFTCLDLSFLTSLIVHSLIARSFGYRFVRAV